MQHQTQTKTKILIILALRFHKFIVSKCISRYVFIFLDVVESNLVSFALCNFKYFLVMNHENKQLFLFQYCCEWCYCRGNNPDQEFANKYF